MFQVSEIVHFCYGHRLLDYVGKCARVHGHNGKVEIVVGGESLDHRGFVMDFSDLQAAAQAFIDERFDHRLLLRADDPLVPVLTAQGEAFVTLDVNPSAENLARLIFEHLRSLGFPLVAVRFFETETSVAVYSRPLEPGRP
jgi:6-pyruvoyltetrahydropterin/6-carboxytetrahydropterin synthase